MLGDLNVGCFSDAVFSDVAAFLADDSGRFVAEIECRVVNRTPPVQLVWARGRLHVPNRFRPTKTASDPGGPGLAYNERYSWQLPPSELLLLIADLCTIRMNQAA